VIACCSSIIGVWAYRIFFTKAPLKWYFLVITLALSGTLLGNLLIVNAKGSGLRIAYGQQFVYGLLNELHLMPLMILAC
jgi:hypothetical protein